jgi:superfamily II DNA/RNA helicase
MRPLLEGRPSFMTFPAARDLFADAQSFPSIFGETSEPRAAPVPSAEPTSPVDSAADSPRPAETEAAVAADEFAVVPASAVAPVTAVAVAAAPVTAIAVADRPTQDAVVAVAPSTSGVPARTFADLGLPHRLVEALHHNDITTPFPIQAATIPDAIAGRDVLGRGQTGSGKTLAFGLPILIRLAKATKVRPGHPAALVLVPTRELAMQVNDAIMPLARVVGLFSRTAFGGTPYEKQIRDLRRGVDILVATPGRLGDLINRGECSLDDIAITVLDEADQMADMGFLPDVTALLEKTPAAGQRLLFSATLDGDVDALVKRFLHDPVTHSVDPSSAAVSTMEHHLLLIPPREKNDIVASIGARDGRTIMFVRTQMAVDRLAEQLIAVGVRAGALHGGKTQRVRTRTLAEFREGKINVLVATDVAARGIHVDDVSLVVHIDPPKDSKDYLHRAGRTARAGEAGTVVTLVMPRQRKTTYSMLDRAGVIPGRTEVSMGAPELAALTGARRPSGIPVKWEVVAPTTRDRLHRDRPERPRLDRTDRARHERTDRPYRGVRDERSAHRYEDRSHPRPARDDHRHRPIRDEKPFGRRPRSDRRPNPA